MSKTTKISMTIDTYPGLYVLDQCVPVEKLFSSFSENAASSDDAGLVGRIIQAYQKSYLTFSGYGDSQWAGNSDRSLDAQAALLRGDPDEVGTILRNPATHDLLYGFDEANLTHYLMHTCRNEPSRDEWARRILYRLVRLGEAVGVVRLWNNETGRGEPLGVGAILDRLSDKFGFNLEFPMPYPGYYGLATSRGIIDHRALIALYCAWKLSTLVDVDDGPRVLEIGAGVGYTAYYARKLGLLDYTIVDLPHTNVAQANYLGRVLDPSCIVLTGETTARRDVVRVLDQNWFMNSTDNFDVVLNCDSITEMDLAVATRYFKAVARRASQFLSINHESNRFSVKDLPNAANVRPRRYMRFPFWMRPGYTEELFFFNL